MDHVENDMDDLFQKAGELYPLNTGKPDWDGVLVKLNSGNIGEDAILPMNEKVIPAKRRRRWLLMLLPLILISYIFFRSHLEHSGSKQSAAPQQSQNIKPKSGVTKNNETISPENRQQNANKTPAKITSHDVNERHKKNESFLQDYTLLTTGLSSSQTESYPEEKWKALSITPGEFNAKPRVEAKPLQGSSPDLHITAALNSKDVKTKKEKNKEQGFYAGVVAGPDLSNVDFQQVSKMGFTLGFIAGYRFTNRISVETGLYWDKKFYYSKGSYFKPNHAISDTVEISQIKGNCNMIELPVAIRYDFAVKKDHRFFARAGLSSYFMQKEDYHIKGYFNTTNKSFYGDTSYRHSPSNIFSIVQLSVGYEQSIGKNTKIRIEPYLKIPTQGVGYGNLPISSAGLLLGFSYSFR